MRYLQLLSSSTIVFKISYLPGWAEGYRVCSPTGCHTENTWGASSLSGLSSCLTVPSLLTQGQSSYAGHAQDAARHKWLSADQRERGGRRTTSGNTIPELLLWVLCFLMVFTIRPKTQLWLHVTQLLQSSLLSSMRVGFVIGKQKEKPTKDNSWVLGRLWPLTPQENHTVTAQGWILPTTSCLPSAVFLTLWPLAAERCAGQSTVLTAVGRVKHHWDEPT